MDAHKGLTMSGFARRFLALGFVALALHAMWERMHVPLYTGYAHLTELPIIYYAVLGDVFYTLVAVLFIGLFKGRVLWFVAPSGRDIAGLVVLGFWIALFVEYKALALGRWAYLDAMPIVPFLGVGLSPLIQMMLLLPLSVFLAAEVDKALRRLAW